MTPPQICPPPPDCPLYAQRVGYGQDEPLRRAILTERPHASLGSLVWADLNRQRQRSEANPGQPDPASSLQGQSDLPPAPQPLFVQSLDQVKGVTR